MEFVRVDYVRVDERPDIRKSIIADMRLALRILCENPKGNVKEIIRLQREIYILLEKEPNAFCFMVPENVDKR